MLRKLARLGTLDAAALRRLAQAAAWLLAVDLGLRALGYARLRALLDRRRPPVLPGRARAGLARTPEIAALARAVDIAARHHLYPMTCLRRSLVLRRLLQKHGIETDLRFGVRKGRGRVAAHCWLVHDGRPLPGLEDAGFPFAELLPASPLKACFSARPDLPPH